jgi:hypothetical protein
MNQSSPFFSTEQLQRLKLELPLVPHSEVDYLQRLFKRLQKSERFLFFKRVPFSKLCASDWVEASPASVWTLEDIVLRGALDVCLMLKVGPSELKEVIDTFSRLLAGDENSDETATPQGVDDTADERVDGAEFNVSAGSDPIRRDSWEKRNQLRTATDIPVYSSVEANRLLSDALGRLRKERNVDLLRSHAVQDFWDSAIARGPFLEELNFFELSELSAEHILKKRSFTGTKLHLLLRAIDCFLNGDSPQPADVESFDVLPSSRMKQSSKRQNVIIFPQSQPELSLSELAMLALLERIHDERGAKVDTLQTLLGFFETRGFLPRLASAIVLEQALLEQRAMTDPTSFAAEMNALLDESAHPSLKHLKTLLLGSGCDEEQLVTEYYSPELGRELSTIFLRLILRSIGAFELRWMYSPEKRFWSLRADSFEHLQRAVLARMPASKDELQTFFRFLAPHLPDSMLRDMMQAAESAGDNEAS